MVLSNAERQRRRREKQKAKDLDKFRENDRNRKRPYYVPVDKLNKKELAARRKATGKRVQLHNKRKKQNETVEIYSPEEGPSKSTRKRGSTMPLLVQLPSFKKKGESVRRRYRSSLRNAYRRIEELEDENYDLEKGKRRIQKRLERERLQKNRESSCSDADVSANLESEIDETESTNLESEIDETKSTDMTQRMTPRKKNNVLLDKLKLTSSGRQLLKKRLLYAECIARDLKEPAKHTDKKVIAKMPFYLTKTYRFLSELKKTTGISKAKDRKVTESKIKKRHNAMKADITTFLTREDNSTIIVSKQGKNVVKVEGEEHQKCVLSDYMHNLHKKYLLENPETKISRASFYSMRPKYLLLADFASRRICLCSRHQNMALKMKAIRSIGLICSKNPDVFVKEQETDQKLRETLETEIKGTRVQYTQWKKVNDDNKFRWKEIEETVSKEEFINIMEKQTSEFRSHINRVKVQYTEMKRLRENLPENDIMLWMDFSENFMCTSVEAVQSSYWNQPLVSLHTMIAYFPDQFQKKLQSYVAVSDSLAHNATTVYAILQKVIPAIKAEFPQLKTIHFLTDSPTSQYKNKTIFKILADLEIDFNGIKGRWNYLESGHGKGPCDGLGSSVKRSADMAIRQGKCLIQGADDFYAWAKHNEAQGSKIKYLHYNQDDIDKAVDFLKIKETPQPVTGTFQLHAVVPISRTTIMTRNVSCYCHDCIADVEQSDHGWTKHVLCSKNTQNETVEIEPVVDLDVAEETINYTGKWVSALYDSKCFL